MSPVRVFIFVRSPNAFAGGSLSSNKMASYRKELEPTADISGCAGRYVPTFDAETERSDATVDQDTFNM